MIGIVIGLTGTYILIEPLNPQNTEIKYSLMVILATICYALSINTIKEKLKSLKSIEIASITSTISVIGPILYIVLTGVKFNIEKITSNISSFYYLLILGGICTSFAIILFNFLIKRSTGLFASSTTYLIPIFAVIWGILDHEIITIIELVGITIILGGVFTMNFQK